MPTRRRRVLVLLLLATFSGCSSGRERKPWPYVVTCGDAAVKVEYAMTEEQRHRGLMFRERLGEEWGMLFIWPEEQSLSFWMKDTRVPLSIAFIGSDRVVRDIQDMEPMTEDSHESGEAVQFALEVNRGWFARNGIKPGSKLKFSAPLDDLVRKTVKRAKDGAE
jgi:uncharacterized membrane protein (UPF0127 family)